MKVMSTVLFTLLLFTLSHAQQTWQRTYGGTGTEYGKIVQQTSDGGYIVSGWTDSFGDSGQVYLIKTTASGDTLWTKTCGGTGDDVVSPSEGPLAQARGLS